MSQVSVRRPDQLRILSRCNVGCGREATVEIAIEGHNVTNLTHLCEVHARELRQGLVEGPEDSP